MKYLTDLMNGFKKRLSVETYLNLLGNLQTMVCLKPEQLSGASRAELILIYHVLDYSAENEGENMTAAQAARLLGVSKPAVSRMLRNLSRKGFIERNYDLRDHRTVRIIVNDAGKQMFESFLDAIFAVLDAALENFSDEELETMVDLHGRFVNAVAKSIGTKGVQNVRDKKHYQGL